MMPELYTSVALTRDTPEAKLLESDTAMYIELIPIPNGEDGAVLEVFNAVGDSISVVTVPLSSIAPLRPDQVPSVRMR